MRLVRLTLLLTLLPIFFLLAALLHLWVSLWRLPDRWRIISRVTHRFAALLRAMLNIKITIEGERELLESRGAFIISNHQGYVDGFVLGSLFPVIYVSKKEVRSWPLIGQWTALCGTVFVDRQHKEKIPLLVEEIVKKLRQKANILVFPEGTSTNGERLLPFQSAPFAAPLRARAAIVPVTLSYKRANGEPVTLANRDKIYWYGDMDFVSHFWNLLALRNIEVSVTIHPKIDTAHYRNNSVSRKQLSQVCHEIILGRGKKDRRVVGAPLISR